MKERIAVMNLSIALFFFFSCNSKDIEQPRICLSFDDNYLENWVELLPILEKHQAKATFFLTGVSKFNEQEIVLVKQIQKGGHEIGAHGENHVSVNSFIKEHGYLKYWREEIEANLISLEKLGIKPKVFALPFGENNRIINFFLRFKFSYIRSVAKYFPLEESINKVVLSLDPFRFNLYSLEIDNQKLEDIQTLIPFMEKAKNNRQILFVHAHDVGLDSNYQISRENFEQIILLAKAYEMEFLTFSEL